MEKNSLSSRVDLPDKKVSRLVRLSGNGIKHQQTSVKVFIDCVFSYICCLSWSFTGSPSSLKLTDNWGHNDMCCIIFDNLYIYVVFNIHILCAMPRLSLEEESWLFLDLASPLPLKHFSHHYRNVVNPTLTLYIIFSMVMVIFSRFSSLSVFFNLCS